ncbi:SPOR domain-containing protein [Uliginosibacterium gangwonense]|uniref:SPOR domain-containing protein n=1 Tax=Uliginosibacterium gangwonense TaxID=392736 RepID=UPI001FE0C929|nr:SPOR domain-containing protein [Uliginosibacterium gangwonense]
MAKYQKGNTVSGVLIGLLIGIIIAAAIALYINFGPKPFTSPKVDTVTKPAQSAPVGNVAPIDLPGKPGDRPVGPKPTVSAPAAANNPPPAASASTPASGDGEKNKFDFYKILPGGDAASTPVPAKPVEAPSNKVSLQAGAYQNPSDADNLKARLALAGVEAKVQRVDLGDKGVFYRVRLGPFDTAAEADAMRARLATEGIETSIVRSNPSASGATTAKHGT